MSTRHGGGQGWWVSYDVSSDRARYRVARILAAEGWRVQYSGFVLPPLDDPDLEHLVDRAAVHLGRGDSILAWPWCEQCTVIGHGSGLESPVAHWVVT